MKCSHFFRFEKKRQSSLDHARFNPLDALQERRRRFAREAQPLCCFQKKVRSEKRGLSRSRERASGESDASIDPFKKKKTQPRPLVASFSLSLSQPSHRSNAADAAPPPPKSSSAKRAAATAAAKKQPAPAAAASVGTRKKQSKSAAASSTPFRTPFLPLFLLLAAARLFSAATNIVHDCDEVFNYWEPLHFALFGSGTQTWEYSSRFALRPWLYLGLHGAVAAPAAALSRSLFGLGFGGSKKVAFYAVRVALALASAAAEAGLAAAAGDVLGGRGGSGIGSGSGAGTRRSGGNAPSSRRLPAVSLILALLLATSAGMFSAAPALLPSSFVMLFLTWAAAEVLRGERPSAVVAAGVFGLLWGWPVACVAFFPYALWVLCATRDSVARTAAGALGLSALALAPLVLLDRLAYGRWTLSLLNFLRYNVSGDGGDSALYGVEEWHYYLRNAALNLGAVAALAAAAPVVLGVALAATRADLVPPPSAAASSSSSSLSISVSPRALARLALALLPLPLWAVTISSLPHKEERFLYPVYPLACLAAAAAVAAAPSAAAALFAPLRRVLLPRRAPSSSRRRRSSGSFSFGLFSFAVQASLVALAALAGISRIAALLASYSAPLRIYSSLPPDPPVAGRGGNHSLVCLGAEWHRFPSSFLLPGESYRLRFVAAGFGGLLPVPFDAARGGAAAAPDSLNDRNARDERNELRDDAACDFFVGIAPPLGDAREEKEGGEWRERAGLPFLDVNAPAVRALPAPARAFYLPRWFAGGVLRRPAWAAEEGLLKERGRYVLMERRRKKDVEE